MHMKTVLKKAHTCVQFFQMHSKKHTWKKLISMYEAVFRFNLCLTLNGVLDL